MPPRILITPGEPTGIGPDILLMAAMQNWPAEIIAICDPDLLSARANLLNLSINFDFFNSDQPTKTHQAGRLKILPVQQNKLNTAEYVINCLKTATELCQKKIAHSLVTGPVHKGIINAAGINFTGHTEYLAQLTNSLHPVMLFVTSEIRVALATTHLPLSEVPKAITQERLIAILSVLNDDLIKRFEIKNPRLLVCGLNPHAGEDGYLGREEIDIITPALNKLRQKGLNIIGPVAADTAFIPKQTKNIDAILAMYHDQALPIVKYIGFGNAVNVTLGLPFIRTSVDHGVAIDIAGTGKADPSSLIAAIKLAIELSSKKENKL